MSEAILALGSNLGDRAANLQAALDLLGERGAPAVRVSSVWETPPVPADQPRYLNAAVAVETALAPEALLVVAKEVERLLGRRPTGHWRPRPIDIDLLFCGEREVASEALTVPHPRIAERAFVLLPLSEVVEGPLPVLGRSAAELLVGLDTSGHERTGVRPAYAESSLEQPPTASVPWDEGRGSDPGVVRSYNLSDVRHVGAARELYGRAPAGQGGDPEERQRDRREQPTRLQRGTRRSDRDGCEEQQPPAVGDLRPMQGFGNRRWRLGGVHASRSSGGNRLGMPSSIEVGLVAGGAVERAAEDLVRLFVHHGQG